VLLTQDYLRVVDSLISQHRETAQQLQLQDQQHAGTKLQQQQQQDEEEQPGTLSSTARSTEHAAMAATLQAFRSRVLPACNDSHITSSCLLQLMRTAAPPASHTQLAKPPAAAAAIGGADAVQRRLLSAELVCRDSRAPESFMFTVPGAAAFVRSVVAGRQELLQMLKRKK
jgi:hypothetical protein